METPKFLEKNSNFDVPVRIFHHGDLTVQGFSRAAFQTYWRIPELKIGFDIGAQPLEFTDTDTWALSHTHADHIAGLPSYIARRDILGMKPPRILLPKEKVADVENLLRAWARVQEYELPVELIGMSPGDRIELHGSNYLTCFRTDHTIISLGFIVWNERHKLKEEFLRLAGPQLETLRKSGVDITDNISVPLVAYTGDTRISALKQVADARRAKILITETTFLRSEKDQTLAASYGHTHMQELADLEHLLTNEVVILGHFSSMYSPSEIKEMAEKILSADLQKKIVLWV